MRKIPPLNSLKSFESAARNGSFHGAADELCVSVSAISHQIKQLEAYLDVDLFNRQNRTVELTEQGAKYYPTLRESFDLIAYGTAKLLQPQDVNILTIQLYSTIAIRWLLPRLPNFQKKYPEIKVRIHTSYEDVDFSHSDVDACIKIGSDRDADLDYNYLFTSELFPVCSASYLENNPEFKQIENLSKASLLQVYPSKQDWTFWLANSNTPDVDPDNGLQFDSYDHALTTATQGLGIALGMQPYLSNELETGILVEPYPNLRCSHVYSWYFVSRKEKSHLKKIKLFKDWLIEEICQNSDLSKLRK